MDVFWNWFWVIVTALFLVLVFGGWWLSGHRTHLLTRAEKADPEQANALREVERQIAEGRTWGGV